LQVSDEEKDSVRSAYLRRHPDAFWVYFLNVITVAKTNFNGVLIMMNYLPN